MWVNICAEYHHIVKCCCYINWSWDISTFSVLSHPDTELMFTRDLLLEENCGEVKLKIIFFVFYIFVEIEVEMITNRHLSMMHSPSCNLSMIFWLQLHVCFFKKKCKKLIIFCILNFIFYFVNLAELDSVLFPWNLIFRGKC